ncbi:MAG: DUF5684 domain-containing protein [Candidatus Saccharimonadales bacterium]
MSLVSTLAQTDVTVYTVEPTSGGGLLGSGLFIALYFFVLALMIVSMWKIFEKAGEEGWKAIVPFYNSYTLFRIAGRNGWGFLLALIPIVNVVVAVMISLDLAKHFGKSSAFGIVGLFLFSVVGFPMLAFGDAEYVGQKHE